MSAAKAAKETALEKRRDAARERRIRQLAGDLLGTIEGLWTCHRVTGREDLARAVFVLGYVRYIVLGRYEPRMGAALVDAAHGLVLGMHDEPASNVVSLAEWRARRARTGGK